MKNRFLKLTVSAVILLTLFSCGKGVPDSSGSEHWSLTDLPLPSGYVLDPMEIPDFDPEEGTVRLFAFTVRNDDGTILCENRRFTLSLDGDVLEETEIPLPSTERVTLALFSEEADTFLSVDSDPKARRYVLYKRIAETGELRSVPLTEFYPDGEKTEPDYLTADGEGVLYIGIGKALLLFDADLNYLKTMTFPEKNSAITALDGPRTGGFFSRIPGASARKTGSLCRRLTKLPIGSLMVRSSIRWERSRRFRLSQTKQGAFTHGQKQACGV